MIKFLWGFALIVFSLGGSLTAKANPVINMVEGATNPANYFIFGQITTYYELLDELDSKRVELELTKKNNDSEQSQIETYKANISRDQKLIENIKNSIATLETQEELTDEDKKRFSVLLPNELADKQASLEANIEALDALQNSITNKNSPNINTLEQEIKTLEDELSKSQIRIRSYAESFVKKILLAIGIWLTALLAKAIIKLIFNRLDFYMTPQRKAFVLQLIRLAINGVAFLAILLVFFSQLIQALPYFAIFATALAFAMRDVILSVIAWLIIGTKDGYKVGHYLHIGTLWGTVVEVNPFNTIVRQGGMSGQTGRLLTFPNKKIFEEFLENWSKLNNFTFLKWDFFLDQGSDIEKAEEILLEVMAKEQARFKDRIEKHRHLFLKKGLEVDDLTPRVFWEIQANGILLRGKLLVDFDDFFEIRSIVTRDFILALNKEDHIHLRFVNNLIPNQF